jgi:hypothetical protein
MTAPEVRNSSPTVDAAIDPSRPANSPSLQIIVEQAQDQLRQLTLQRQEIAQKIAVIKHTINGLALLYGGELRRSSGSSATPGRRRGITDACRIVLSRADNPLSAREVYAILQEEFPDLSRQSGGYYASLVTILNRLANYGEFDMLLRNGSRFWRRHQIGDQSDVLAPKAAGNEINDEGQLASCRTSSPRGSACS